MHGRTRTRWTVWRRLSQLCFVLFFVGLPLTHHLDQRRVLGTLASLSIGPVSLVDPGTGFSTVLASLALETALLMGMLLPVLLALCLGPVFCSWVCPWGLISELIAVFRRPARRSALTTRYRFGLLALIMMASLATGLPLVATVSAPRAITSLPLEALYVGAVAAGTIGLLAALFIIELFAPRRLWCRILCPVGSTLVLLRTPRTLSIRVGSSPCERQLCGSGCRAACSWELDPRALTRYDGCTNCGACIEGCVASGRSSLSFGFGRGNGRSPQRQQRSVVREQSA